LVVGRCKGRKRACAGGGREGLEGLKDGRGIGAAYTLSFDEKKEDHGTLLKRRASLPVGWKRGT